MRPDATTRRQLLAALGGSTLAALAGCGGSAAGSTPSTTDGNRTGTRGTLGSATPTGTERTTATDAATETPTSGPTDVPTSDADLPERAAATFRGDLRNRGYYPEKTVPDAVEVEWSLPGINKGDHSAAKASAVLAPDGNLVWPGDNGSVYSITRDGDVEWAAATDPSGYGIHGTPTVVDGSVYVGAYDGAMYSFDLETGRREWKTDLGDAIGSSPRYYDGTIYIAVEYIPPDGSVFALDAATGDVLAEAARPTDHPHSTIGIDLGVGKLVVGSNDGNLYAWEFPSLEQSWTFETGDAIKGPVTIYDGAAFFGSWDNYVYAVDLKTGQERWEFETGHMVMSGPAVDPDRGIVYVGSHDDHLYAIDADAGPGDGPEWSFDAEGWIIGCPTITKETVLVGSHAHHLWAVDRDSGELRWSVEVEGEVSSTPLVVGDEVYFAERATDEETGHAYALAPK